jgi:hypothetical protein
VWYHILQQKSQHGIPSPHSPFDIVSLTSLEEMLARLQHINNIANLDVAVSQRRDLHAEAGLLAASIDDTVPVERGARLVTVCNACLGVDIGQFAASGAAGNMVRRVAYTSLGPVVLMEGGGAGDVDVCAETESIEKRYFPFGEWTSAAGDLRCYVVNRRHVENVDGELRR